MKRVIFHDDAKAEVRKALEWYEDIRAELASSFPRALDLAVERIGENQFLYAEDEGYRLCMHGRFPYTLVFVELESSIWVAAVTHQKRRPRYWERRRPEHE